MGKRTALPTPATGALKRLGQLVECLQGSKLPQSVIDAVVRRKLQAEAEKVATAQRTAGVN